MKITMSLKELKRSHVIQQCVDGSMTVSQAALRLGLSERRIKQLKKEFRLHGPTALIHGNAKRPSPKQLDPVIAKRILDLRSDSVLQNTNFTHFREILEKRYGICVSYSTLYRLLTKANFKSPKSRRKKKDLHPLRERRSAFGAMLQADGTSYAWFGGQERYCLHGFIDDATGKITGLWIAKNECLLGYLEVLRQTLTHFGIPQSLYPDRYSVFFYNPKKEGLPSIQEQLDGQVKRVTQFGKIMERLGIDMFPASSPQAKGRIERLWNTLQSRLPVEFAIHGITTMEEANTFLPKFIAEYNKQFAVEPADPLSSFVPVPADVDLDRILCATITRKLNRGSTISITGHLFRIEQKLFSSGTTVTVLIDAKHGPRALINGSFYPIHPIDPITHKVNKPRGAGDLPIVFEDLIKVFLLANAKTQRVPA